MEETLLKMSAVQRPNLMDCYDCGKPCSRNAESCPHCGRYIQRFASNAPVQEVIVSRVGWISTIAWGILLAAVMPWIILFGIIVLLFMLSQAGRSPETPLRPPTEYFPRRS